MSAFKDLSRRAMLALAGAAALPIAARGDAPLPASPAKAPPPEGDLIQGLADKQRHLTIDTYIGDRGPFRFIVDTGADRTVIADTLALKLGHDTGKSVIVEGIARSVAAETVKLRDLHFGTVSVDALEAPILPAAWLGADGYLGLDVIDGRRVTFDFQNQTLLVANSRPTPDFTLLRVNEALVQVRGSGGRLVATNCHIDDVEACAFVDSGAQLSIGNGALFAELHRKGVDYYSSAVIPVIGATGGFAPGRPIHPGRIRIGGMGYSGGRLLIADLPIFELWGLKDRPALFLGMNFLETTSSVTIDYVRKELRFKLADIGVAWRAA